jgi:hypothetical protein
MRPAIKPTIVATASAVNQSAIRVSSEKEIAMPTPLSIW